LEILADPDHSEALNILGVPAASFDPARFAPDAVNARLSNPAAGPTLRFQL
jgi:hypothetical protein